MEEELKDKYNQEPEEQEIDLVELAKKLWSSKRALIWAGVIGVVAGLIVAFSIPKEYTTTVKLAPEFGKSSSKNLNNLGALASMAGLNMSMNIGSTNDAVYPTLYPDVVESVPFIVDLFDTPVEDSKGEIKTDLYTYIKEYNSGPWWGVIMSAPFKAIGAVKGLFTDKEEVEGDGKTNPFKLTVEEDKILKALNSRINVDVDTKTMVISVKVTMQDPLISANIADTVVSHLKEFVTNYRTDKARKDLEYAENLNAEAQKEYYQAQQQYAEYVDKNHGIAFNSRKTEEARLQQEAQLKYNLYNSTAQQVQMAKAKVQENTPVYTVTQPATVPIKASKPSKLMMLVAFVFLAVAGTAAWILFGRDFVAQFKTPKEEEK